MSKAEILLKVKSIEEALLKIVRAKSGSCSIIKAPPGSGKTTMLRDIAVSAKKEGLRIAIATQTNNQADEICSKISEKGEQCTRLLSSKEAGVISRDPNITFATKFSPPGKGSIVVATSSKWGFTDVNHDFDILFVEEAWQLKHADFLMYGNRIADKIILCGDPGQIPPTVTISTERWATHELGPHLAVPEILQHRVDQTFELPATRRLPHDTTKLIKNFYDFDFASTAAPGDRRIIPQRRNASSSISKAFEHFENSSYIGLTVKTPKNGPPQELDMQIVQAAVRTAEELVNTKAEVIIDGEKKILLPGDIGIVSTHRIMVNRIKMNLPTELKALIDVDTPERWQGLQKKAMIAVHPLSGTTRPSPFDLETGRLCVMASRHRAGLIIISRDHVQETLGTCYPPADHPFTGADISGKGLFQHESFWNSIIDVDKVIQIDEDIAA